MKPIQALKLSGDIVQNWHDFLKKFKIFMATDAFEKKSDTEKLAVFLDAVGKEAHEIFETFNIPAKEVTGGCIVNKLIHRFQEYFTAFKNVPLYNTSMFFSRVQKPDESFDSYLKDVEEIAKWCQFGSLMKKMVRDRIISGINDLNLQYKFKTMKDPTLEEIVDNCRELERAKEKLNAIIGRGNFFFSPNEKFNDASTSFNDCQASTRLSTNETESSSSEDDGSTDSDNEEVEVNRAKRMRVKTSSSIDSGLDLKDSSGSSDAVSNQPRERFQCHRCPKSYANKSHLKIHLMKCRSKKKPKGSNSLESWLKKSNTETNHQDDIKIANNKSKAETPSNSNSSLERFPCVDCGLDFAHLSSLKRHRRDTCEKRFGKKSRDASDLRKELDSPKEEKVAPSRPQRTVTRDDCGIANNKSKEDRNSSPDRFRCDHCGLDFSFLSSLNRHRRDTCEKVFKERAPRATSEVRKEQSSPKKELKISPNLNSKFNKSLERFPCVDCGLDFKHLSSLHRHRRDTCAKRVQKEKFPDISDKPKVPATPEKPKPPATPEKPKVPATPEKPKEPVVPEKPKEPVAPSQQPSTFICDDCGLAYSSTTGLRRHEMRCDIKMAKLSSANILNGKEAIVVLKPSIFKCQDCGSAFSHYRSVKRHRDNNCPKRIGESNNPIISDLLKEAEQAFSDPE